jgi:hypothetical protein
VTEYERSHFVVHPGYAERNRGWFPYRDSLMDKRFSDYVRELEEIVSEATGVADEAVYVLDEGGGDSREFWKKEEFPEAVDDFLTTSVYQDILRIHEKEGLNSIIHGSDELVLHGELHGEESRCIYKTEIYLRNLIEDSDQDLGLTCGTVFPENPLPPPGSF